MGNSALIPSAISAPGSRAHASILLEVEQVSRFFGGLAALDDVSFQILRGEVCGLIGPNGAGKTTLINIISGLIPLSHGRIRLERRIISGLKPHQVAAQGVGRTFQNIRLFTELSVIENVMVGHHLRAKGRFFSWDDRTTKATAMALLHRLQMDHLAPLEAGTLSYGDQRRVEIARALAMEPRLLLLDEPAAGMISAEKERLIGFLLEVRNSGLTLLIIEHDMDLIMHLSDKVVVLNFGRKIAEGPPALVRNNRQVIEAYLGEEG
ncbi:MAG: ABC transporter ATP-binding protein [Chloroflexi bacterium]|nr:ABC transporter ATP-binding protein [Chloroflexota bacterium]